MSAQLFAPIGLPRKKDPALTCYLNGVSEFSLQCRNKSIGVVCRNNGCVLWQL